MEAVEGMMERMKLSMAEKKGIRVQAEGSGTSFHPNLSSSGRECINRMNKNNPYHLLPLPKFQTLQYDPNIHPPNLLLREFHDFFHGFPLHHETRILSSSDPRSS
uniref:Uncharacterized protein n=1 Tax=Oryza rufipogon TaxID=4529 RepID=A0A0E0N1L8_ORYRU